MNPSVYALAMNAHADYESFERLLGDSFQGPSSKARKRGRKFACALCGKDIPPGKPDRRCKECRSKELAIDTRHLSLQAPKDAMPVFEKAAQMGNTHAVTAARLSAYEHKD